MSTWTKTGAAALMLGLWMAGAALAQGTVSGELKKWHRLSITFDGPQTSEDATPNPFADFRLLVKFTQGGKSIEVPGFYAADGNAAETSAKAGNKWRVHFTPDAEGEWSYEASFRTGQNIAADADPQAGQATGFDGAKGRFTVGPTDKDPRGRDLRGKGMLRYVGGHYLQFADSGEYYLKAGADSPENFLAYVDFDDTSDLSARQEARAGEATANSFLHRYEPHVQDWRQGDPTWKEGKGKGIIGALNYLASQGMNSVYFLTYNIDGGDGKDTWPWTASNQRLRFDCSKLDQWEIVFSHMDKLGLQLHVVTQETENDQGLDGGELGLTRKLYYRELVARFAHHPALEWNLGEENTNTDPQRKAFAQYLHALDAYDHPVVLHTYPGQYDKVYTPLLGFAHLEGPSLQMGGVQAVHRETLKWVEASAKAGRKWVVCLDEIGPADTGVKPDKDDPGHDAVRSLGLWGNLMAGGAGCEWYFGYKFAHNDLNCEDWRSRQAMWDQTRYAVEFFQNHLPFAQMSSADDLLSAKGAYCFAKAGQVYAVYLPGGAKAELKLPQGTYAVKWFNPRQGGQLKEGSIPSVSGPGTIALGLPPADPQQDWVVLLQAK